MMTRGTEIVKHAGIMLIVLLATASLADTHAQTKRTAPARRSASEIAVVNTVFGTFEIQLYRNDAPRTVKNFVDLANSGYFNGVKVHRISKDFVIQTGDPTGTGHGGQSIYGKPFEDEIKKNGQFVKKKFKKATGGSRSLFTYTRGVVAMANRGQPATNTSQFFILLKDTDMLPDYTIFGRVIRGMEVVDKIAAREIIPVLGPTDGKPKQDIFLTAVTISQPENK